MILGNASNLYNTWKVLSKELFSSARKAKNKLYASNLL